MERELVGEQHAELVYVCLGSSLPRYAISSLQFSAKATGFRVRVLADFAAPKEFPKELSWTVTSGFYREELFVEFKNRSKLPGDFRNGFWLKTAERFFVLRDYLHHSDAKSLFHAELDVLVYSLQPLQQAVEESKLLGVFVPREAGDRVVASLLYTNSVEALDNLCAELIRRADQGNEMDILGSLTGESSPWMHNLPTAEYLYRQHASARAEKPWPVVGGHLNMVIDGAVLGRWLYGVDPRNTKFAGTRNLIQQQKHTVPFDFPLKELKFDLNIRQKKLLVRRLDGPWNEVLAIHVHSKIHQKLSGRRAARIIRRANELRESTIVRKELEWYGRGLSRLMKDAVLFTKSRVLRRSYFLRAKNRLIRWLDG